MNNPKVKTQKNLATLLGVVLAAVTLFNANTVSSSEPVAKKVRLVEADIIAQIDEMLLEDQAELEEILWEEDEASILEQIDIEEFDADEQVKVFGENDQLLGEGNTQDDNDLRILVNKAELVTEFANTKYYRIVR